MSEVVIHTDGGSRGNPGPSAIGVVIDLGIRGIKEYGEAIGKRTNNEAEYEAVIFALKKTKALLGSLKANKTMITVCMDSELIVKQLNGEYKIKEKEFYPLFIAAWNTQRDFHKVRFKAISREQNARADSIVNQTLDQNSRKQLAF